MHIRTPEVRVIDDKGNMLGVMTTKDAMEKAQASGMDLVEVNPKAEPPIVKFLDFGKFQYERRRKEREAKKAQKIVEIKEVQLRPKTDGHHLGFKVRDARGWIEDGMKVLVRVRFRGREREYPNIAADRMRAIAAELQDVAVVEQPPTMEGNSMSMMLAPAGNKKK